MLRRVWVGSEAHTPAGWLRFETIDAFLRSDAEAEWVVVDDPAAALREPDYLRLFARAPFAKVQRRVSPWRGGVNRTDSVWPASSLRLTPVAMDESARPVPWFPSTASYDDLAGSPPRVSLVGVTASVCLTDLDLQDAWIDALRHSGVNIRRSDAQIVVGDDVQRPSRGASLEVLISLRPDPWNAGEFHSDADACDRTESVGENLPNGVSSKLIHEFVFDRNASPLEVISVISAVLGRVRT